MRGTNADPHAGVLGGADQVERIARLRQRDDDPLDTVTADRRAEEREQVVRRAGIAVGHRQRCGHLDVHAGRVELDPDGADALRIADDQAALRGAEASRDLACDHAAGDEQRERGEPDRGHGARVELDRRPPVVGEPDAEREESGDLQEVRDLVERRLLDHDLVALVEAADLVDEHDHRHRPEGEHRRRPVGQERDHDQEDERGGDRVGDAEAAAVEALANPRRLVRVALGDERGGDHGGPGLRQADAAEAARLHAPVDAVLDFRAVHSHKSELPNVRVQRRS